MLRLLFEINTQGTIQLHSTAKSNLVQFPAEYRKLNQIQLPIFTLTQLVTRPSALNTIFEISMVTFTKLTHTTLNMEISGFPEQGVLTTKPRRYE